MRALLINPADLSVTEVEHNGDYKQIYTLIDCRTFACPVEFPNGDALYCDDEGLFNDNIIGGFKMRDWVMPIVGKCLILGTDVDSGNSISAKSSIEDITKDIVEWLSPSEADAYADKVINY